MISSSCLAQGLYGLSAKDISGSDTSLAIFSGKVALVVNTASNCGFTPQYGDLEQLYNRFKDRGFVVLAFPSNDFMGQEPGSDVEIQNFCSANYNISFPLFAKGHVKGRDKQPVYKFLAESNEFSGDPGWNFVKFLVNKRGEVVGRFSSMTKPLSKEIVSAIERELSIKE